MAAVGALLIVGFVLLLAETLLPKGVFGTVGVLLLIAGIGIGYYTLDNTIASYILAGTVTCVGLLFLLWMRYFPGSRIGKKFTTNTIVGEPDLSYRQYLGKTGTAQTALRPAGIVIVDGRRLDVVTEGAFVEAGSEVSVVATDGNRVVVRPV